MIRLGDGADDRLRAVDRNRADELTLLAGSLDGWLPPPDVARFLADADLALSRKRAFAPADDPVLDFTGRMARSTLRVAVWRVLLAYENRSPLPAAVRRELNEAVRHAGAAHAALHRARTAALAIDAAQRGHDDDRLQR